MKQDLYEKIVTYIIENQNNFYRLAYCYVQNQEDALDVVQNTACKVLEHYESLRNEDAIRTWVYKIVVNEILRFLKEKNKIRLLEENEQMELSYEEKAFDIQEDLYTQINHLDVDEQNIIKLRFYEGLSLKEIAEITEVNLNTVKAKLYRGLRKLKAVIRPDDIETY
ncbi:MAG: sigma-70 family RNA polymerase sigma factor [Lachnospiraceae bacterium]|nr:sigma-70 family RNA polymerase sigma factor [Lachnospiraceae bacterium]